MPPGAGDGSRFDTGRQDVTTDTTFAWPVHPAAELFPLLGDDELRELADDIRSHGLHEPVWLWDDPDRGTVLLDGRNRARACQLADIEVRTRRYDGDDPIAFSISANEKRRHLTAGQRDFLALEVEKLYAAEAARRRSAGARSAARRKASSLLAQICAVRIAVKCGPMNVPRR